MVSNAVLLVGRTERDRGDDSPGLSIGLRAYVNRTRPKAVYGFLHAVGVSISVGGFTVDQSGRHVERETGSWKGYGYVKGDGGWSKRCRGWPCRQRRLLYREEGSIPSSEAE